MGLDINDLMNAVSGDDFEERPVDIQTFVTSPDYLDLGQTPLSEYQYQMIRASSQIYKESTLISLYGLQKGREMFEATVNEVIMQLGKGCHAPYTPIYNPETGNWNRIDLAQTDGKVVSGDSSIRYATEAFVEGVGAMVRVRTALGFEEDVYVGHKYLSYSKSRFYHRYRGTAPTYSSISDLKVGDRIAIGMGFDVDNPKNIPVEHAELIGYWLGDGMLPADHNPIINMDFCSDEIESIARYEELCEYIGDSPTKTVHKTKNLTYFRHGKNSNAVALAKEYGLWGMRSKSKSIPDAVWASDNSILSAVVSKLWQTDGCVYSKNGVTAEFVSVSKQLTIDVQRMLLRLGVPSSIRFRVPKSNFSNASEAGCVTVSSQESINAFATAVSLLDHKRIEPVDKSGRVYSRIDGNVYYDRIVSIESIGDGEYWTRTVPDTGNYVGNGMVSSNSGKDFTSTIACAYIVYLLLCLRDPAAYYNKPPGDTIDIINIAINSQQANNVFFKGFVNRIERSPWFVGKYEKKAGQFAFIKNVNVYSGHSEREAWEGYNVIYVVLDEISGFALDVKEGNEQSKTAQAIYNMYRASVTSRFPDFGKLVLLSFPRFIDDFIQQRYNAVIGDKETLIRSHTFKLDEKLPDGTSGNEFTIEWEEDHIVRYKSPRVFALKRPSWEVNPTKNIRDYMRDFYDNAPEALGKYACMPPKALDAFFKDKEKVENAFNQFNGVDEDGRFMEFFQPKEGVRYFIHVDLAQKQDKCAVAIAHVDKWERRRVGEYISDVAPVVVVDAVRWWTPSKTKQVDFTDVREFIVQLQMRGFDIRLVTFDRWNSEDIMKELRQYSLKSEVLSVAKKHYTDMAMVVHEERLHGPNVSELINELLALKITKQDKVDHTSKSSKDLSDAVCGAIYNAIALTPRDMNVEIDVVTLSSFKEQSKSEYSNDPNAESGVIKAPSKAGGMPMDLSDFLASLRIIGS